MGTAIIFIIRAFTRLYSSPAACSLETAIALLIVMVFELGAVEMILPFSLLMQFTLHRLCVFVNKLVYITVSFMTAFSNKKQRFRNQWICIAL